VKLAITSDEFLGLVRPILLPNFFSSVISENCVQICYDYWDSFKKAPRDHFHDELVRRLPGIKEDDRPFYAQYLEKIQNLSTPDVDYVVTRVSRFVQCREFESAAIKFAELVREGQFDEASNLMYEALRSGIRRENIGLDYFSDFSYLSKRGLGEEYLIPTGVSALDQLIKGYRRTQLLCFLGGYKGKKSWALQHLARTALLWGRKVVYVSHELSREQVERRFDRSFGALVKDPEARDVRVCYRDEKTGEFRTEIQRRPSVFDIATVKKVRQKVKRMGGRLIIKKYPIGTCTVDELNRYLNYLERFEEFVPDVLVNDYADIMAYRGRGDNPRHGINDTYLGLKAIADERNCLVVTASQGNREAIRKKKPSQKDVAEDIRKLANVDTMIGVCQTEEMAQQELASLWVVVNRDDIMDVGCNILMNLDIGQFCVSSWVDM
jgi:hypothetical protein